MDTLVIPRGIKVCCLMDCVFTIKHIFQSWTVASESLSPILCLSYGPVPAHELYWSHAWYACVGLYLNTDMHTYKLTPWNTHKSSHTLTHTQTHTEMHSVPTSKAQTQLRQVQYEQGGESESSLERRWRRLLHPGRTQSWEVCGGSHYKMLMLSFIRHGCQKEVKEEKKS